ncbi:LytR C-terminal domain-containing protein [Streptomyces capparidis]
MSMLTPPGMGGKYRITGDAYPRMRRRRGRRAVTGTAALLALGVLGWGTVELVDVFRGGTAANAAEHRCDPARRPAAAPPPKPLPEARAVTVNVFNATTRSGLAKQTADELKRRGFTVREVGNAPEALDKKVRESALLLGGSRSGPALDLLGTHLAGEGRRTDGRGDGSVDLVIGDAYKGLATAQDAGRALAALTRPAAPASPSKAAGAVGAKPVGSRSAGDCR